MTEALASETACIDLPLQTRADVRLQAETIDAEARTVEVVWSTGATVRRRDLWTGKRYDEMLSLDPRHVDLSRLNGGAPLLNTHGAFDLVNVIGVVERAWITKGSDGHEGRAESASALAMASSRCGRTSAEASSATSRSAMSSAPTRLANRTARCRSGGRSTGSRWSCRRCRSAPMAAPAFARARVSRPAASSGRRGRTASTGRRTPSNRRAQTWINR